MNRIQTLMVSIAVPLGAAVLAACGSSSGGSAGAPPPATSTASAQSTSASGGSSGSVTIKTASVGKLGSVVVNGQGMTLYRFDADTANPPTSHCNGSCANYWPPVLAGSGTPQVQGVSASLLGTVTRSDGTKQVTLNGWPLYTYVGDHSAGEANGQGLNASGATWWALTPTGQKAGSPGGGSSGGGYGSGGAGGY